MGSGTQSSRYGPTRDPSNPGEPCSLAPPGLGTPEPGSNVGPLLTSAPKHQEAPSPDSSCHCSWKHLLTAGETSLLPGAPPRTASGTRGLLWRERTLLDQAPVRGAIASQGLASLPERQKVLQKARRKTKCYSWLSSCLQCWLPTQQSAGSRPGCPAGKAAEDGRVGGCYRCEPAVRRRVCPLQPLWTLQPPEALADAPAPGGPCRRFSPRRPSPATPPVQLWLERTWPPEMEVLSSLCLPKKGIWDWYVSPLWCQQP